MKILKNFFSKNKKSSNAKLTSTLLVDQYVEIGKLVKEARIKKNISTEELSRFSKIPEYLINSIENNIEQTRPTYPFIRSILIKLEECLSLQKNTLVSLLITEKKTSKKGKKDFILRKFDFINTWEGTLIYFLLLVISIVYLKKYFVSNEIIIQIRNFEEKINEK